MKVCVIQPSYSFCAEELDRCFDGLLEWMDRCDDTMDLIVLPEYSDALADVKGKAGFYNAVAKYGPILLQKARETAKRCTTHPFSISRPRLRA